MSFILGIIVVVVVGVGGYFLLSYTFNSIYHLTNPNAHGFDFWQNLAASAIAIVVTVVVGCIIVPLGFMAATAAFAVDL